jgi:hypothetical protein
MLPWAFSEGFLWGYVRCDGCFAFFFEKKNQKNSVDPDFLRSAVAAGRMARRANGRLTGGVRSGTTNTS